MSGHELAAEFFVFEQSRYPSQRFQVIGRGVFRRDQHEKQVRRRAVQRREIDAFGTARKNTQDSFNAGQLAVWNSDALADRGGADLFSIEEHVEYGFLFQRRMMGRQPIGHFFESSILFPAAERGNDGLYVNKVGDLHALGLLRLSLVFAFCFFICRSILSIAKSIAAYIS